MLDLESALNAADEAMADAVRLAADEPDDIITPNKFREMFKASTMIHELAMNFPSHKARVLAAERAKT